MKNIAIIPARMGSTRLPGKPLKKINGIPMLGLVYHAVKKSKLLDAVYIATCDDEILRYSGSINAPCVMTSTEHERCSDRTAEALLKIEKKYGVKVENVVMVQGDEPMVSARMIDAALAELISDDAVGVVNLMARIDSINEYQDPNEVKVVVDKNMNALYFTREPIPSQKKGSTNLPMYKQVCVIPFKRDYLLKFNSMSEMPLEAAESIDMLRILEHGDKVRMVLSNEKTYSVDTQQDLDKVNSLFDISTELQQVEAQ